MHVEWTKPRCISCLAEKELSVEHVIPASLGGILTTNIICRSCNGAFGAGFQAGARLAPEIRRAAAGLDFGQSDLKEKLERGAEYVSDFGGIVAKKRIRGDGSFGTLQHSDNSLIVPENETANRLRSILAKDGVSDTEIEAAIELWKDAPVGEMVDLTDRRVVKKWHDHPSRPTYAEQSLTPLVPLKVAYHFAALILGASIYKSEFDDVRRVINDQCEEGALDLVRYQWAQQPDAFHGIAFLGNNEFARFQVRLFGRLAYSVEFPNVAINSPNVVYTQDLSAGEDYVQIADESNDA